MRRTGLAVVLLLVSACLGSDFADSIEGNWILESGSGDGGPLLILDDHPITLTLDGAQIGGVAACNLFGGNYRVGSTGNFQIVEGLAITEMDCSPPEVMDSESQFMTAILAVDKVALVEGGLIFTGGGYEMRFVANPDAPPPAADGTTGDPDQPVSNADWFSAETHGDWVLVTGTADGSALQIADTHPITLSLSDQGFGGTSGCNGYGFALPLPADGSFPPIVSTMMACDPPEVMDAEAAYLSALQRFESASIVDGQLVIEGDGVLLVYDPA
ncbi:MAG: META domain-containing protein [Actinobacteria bacterium]|nr:META domain-containing protein [Actinomycetota bacterium]